MDSKYYGATSEARACINKLLALPATGHEQDWEIEFADISRIDEMLNLFDSQDLNLECKSALMLLIICSIDESGEINTLNSTAMQKLQYILSINDILRKRMHFYWIELRRANQFDLVKSIISV